MAELTQRQIKEHAADEARRDEAKEKEPKPQISRAMEARNFYRKQAGWPALNLKTEKDNHHDRS